MFTALKSIYRKQQFSPGLFGLFVNPFYFARKGLYLHISSLAAQISGRTLDVGCGQKPYEHLCRSSSYIGLEIDTPENRTNKKADYYYDGIHFPFGAKEFDSVISNQVFEHVFTPDLFLLEIFRVLKDDGILLLTVPFVWDEHEQPHDFARYSSFGLRALLQNNGFVIVDQRKSINDIRCIFQLINDYIYKKTVSRNRYLNLLVMLSCMMPVNVIGELLSKIFPSNDDLYLDNIVLARKVKTR